MTETRPLAFSSVDPGDFEVRTFDDEIRVDQLCTALLLAVRDRLLADGTGDPVEIGTICRGADYFLREFVIAECGDNLFRLPPERVRQFAGHWYIVRNLEPNIAELAAILAGICAVYHVLKDEGLVDAARAEEIGTACTELTWYRQRIDDFWDIAGDGFTAWQAACPLPPQRS
ncbi:MAG: hypothetical protein FDZ69_00565 [Deltaproteobacteria bacterium]|nr:MAG: hypothetical protein FDZ69_00565 [Deltaproteobacteria bacterium]